MTRPDGTPLGDTRINPTTVSDILAEVFSERVEQNRKWGQQDHPDGTGGAAALSLATQLRQRCDDEHHSGVGTFASILAEEVGEAFAEHDPAALRVELIQVAAVACCWAEAIDRRRAAEQDEQAEENVA